MHLNSSPKGFTLIELMVVIVIVGILSAIAIPAYTDYVDKARRTDAINGINNLATALERYYSIYSRYTRTLSGLPDPASTGSPDGFYNMTVTSSANQSFTITATRDSSKSDDTQCNRFLLTDTGIKSAFDTTPADSTNQCWKLR